MALVLAEDSATHETRGNHDLLYALSALTVVTFTVGLVRYLVTRWALEGPSLRIETGLLRRDARRLPVARVQAVDVVKPFLARAAGLAELRIRLAGSGRPGGRLAYLSEPVALDLRARILAGHHGLDQSTPTPTEVPVATVPVGRLILSVVFSGATVIGLVWLGIAGWLAAGSTSSESARLGAGTFVLYIVAFARLMWRRVADQYGFSVGLAPDGIRVRRGLLSTVAETIPFARVQAVRTVQPLIWRLFGWCRLEVDVAGSPGEEQGTRSSRVTKALLPVGRRELAEELFSSLLGLRQFPLGRPPARARWKAPLSYHFLAAGTNGAVVASTVGRLRKVTTWVPLGKVQSIRWAQGPLQRALHLATVHVDAAGRRAHVECRERSVAEAATLFQQLIADSRAARRRSVAPQRTAAAQSPALARTAVGQPLAPPPGNATGANAGPLWPSQSQLPT